MRELWSCKIPPEVVIMLMLVTTAAVVVPEVTAAVIITGVLLSTQCMLGLMFCTL